ncbi:hypothetical protein [Pelagibius sp. 7325]|uniref:hypothetical protein n=1 Tax=Pelagibius sp. 7325 TaxID=3131994 RepID=UPI0030ED4660
MVISRRHADAILSLLLVIFALDLPRLVIEMMSLPLPLLGGQPPYLMPMVLLLPMVYMPALRERSVRIFPDTFDLLFIGVMGFWIFLETFLPGEGRTADFTLVTANLVVFVGYIVIRQHVQVFGAHTLVQTAVAVLTVVVSGHLLVLALDDVGFAVPLLNMAEVRSRNGLSLLGLLVLFLVWFVWPVGSAKWRYFFLPGIVIIHIWLNEARAAAVIFLALAAVSTVPAVFVNLQRRLLAFVCAVVGVIAVAAHPMALEMRALDSDGDAAPFGNDDRASLNYRQDANRILFQEFLRAPITGQGYQVVKESRSGPYISHTYLLFPFAAYGILGVVPYLIALLFFLRQCRGYDPRLSILIPFFFLGMLAVTNDLWAWMGLLMAVAAHNVGSPRSASELGVQHG